MPTFGSSTNLSANDKIHEEIKVTAGYFSNDGVQLVASNITTTSLSSDNETYYYGISETSSQSPGPVEFNVTYGKALTSRGRLNKLFLIK